MCTTNSTIGGHSYEFSIYGDNITSFNCMDDISLLGVDFDCWLCI